MAIHHVSLFVRDAERSLRFYRDGLGFQVLLDKEFDGEWPALFGVKPTRLRAVICADPAHPDTGGVELVTFAEPLPEGPPPAAPTTGSALLAFQVELEEVLPKLLANGATDLRRATLSRGNKAATVRDPDGFLIELLDTHIPGQD